MKNKNLYKLLLFFAVFSVIVSCEKNHDFTPNQEYVSDNSAKIKFIHSAVGPLGVNYRINFFVNDVKTTAIATSSSLPLGMVYNTQYPLPINYALVPSGSQSLKAFIPATATIPESQVLTEVLNFEKGKNYSCFLTGTAPNYSIFKVNDDFSVTEVDKSKAYIRILNLVTNTPAAGYDYIINRITSAPSVTPVVRQMIKTISGVNYKGVSDVFVPLDVVPELENTAYEIQLRATGTTTILNTYIPDRGFIPRPNRVYTIYSVGVAGGIPNATTNAPTISFYTNK